MATKNIFEVLSDHEGDQDTGSSTKGPRQRGNRTGGRKQEKNPTNLSETTGKEKIDKSHHKQPLRDDRHSRNGPQGITKNTFKKNGGGALNIGTVDAELRGADSYAPKELVGSKGREEEEVVDANAPKTITLRDYYKEKGIKSALQEREEANRVQETKIDTEALKKEKLTLITRKEETHDDRTKAKNRGGNAGYKAGFNSNVDVELLGFKTAKQYVEPKPERKDRDERKTEDKPATTAATEETTATTTETTSTAAKTEEVPAAETTTEGTTATEGGDGKRGNRGNRGGDRGNDRGDRGNDRGNRGGDNRGNRGGDRGGYQGEGRKFDNNRKGGPRGGENPVGGNKTGGGGGRKTGGRQEFKGGDDDFPELG